MTEAVFYISGLFISAGIIYAVLIALIRSDRASKDISSTSFDLAVFRDQLDEIDRDRELGRLPEAEAAAARAEIERRMLRAIDRSPSEGPVYDEVPVSSFSRTIFPVCLGLVAVLATGGLYLNLGTLGLKDAPLSSRQDSQSSSSGRVSQSSGGLSEGRAMIARLTQRLQNNPNDLQGWVTLGRTQRSLGEYNSAVKAFERALQVAGDNSSAELLSDYGETLVFESFGTVSPRAVEIFKEALAKDPQEIKSRFYIAASRSQLGDYRGAIALWRGLTADAPPDAPWLESVREQISNAAMKGGIMPMSVEPERAVGSTSGLTGAIAGDVRPDQETVAAVQEMAPSDQKAFIRSMVQRLADRMEKNPDDVDGWLRLGRAYKVLEDPQKANDAFKRAKISLEKVLSKVAVGSSTRSNLERKLRDIEDLING